MSIIDELERQGIESAMLDDIVHDAASSLAASANNGGRKEQVNFLKVVCGWSDEEILAKAEEMV